MDNFFFNFIKPYLAFIDKGDLYRKPFSWLYYVIGGLNLIFPLFILYQAIDGGIFGYGTGKLIFVFIVFWLILAFSAWIGFQIWIDRGSKILYTSEDGDEFVATPVFSHFVQTFGEWLGTWIAIAGFGFALLTTLFLGDEAYGLSREIGYGLLNTGWIFIFLMPIYGFLIIVITRFLAEQFRALACIANNTKKK